MWLRGLCDLFNQSIEMGAYFLFCAHFAAAQALGLFLEFGWVSLLVILAWYKVLILKLFQ